MQVERTVSWKSSALALRLNKQNLISSHYTTSQIEKIHSNYCYDDQKNLKKYDCISQLSIISVSQLSMTVHASIHKSCYFALLQGRTYSQYHSTTEAQ